MQGDELELKVVELLGEDAGTALVEELKDIINEASGDAKKSDKLSTKLVQSVSLVLGMSLFLGVQAELVKTEIPDWIYILFLGGFLSGYDSLALLPFLTKLRGGKDV